MNKLTKKNINFSLITFLIIFVDQITKLFIRNTFELGKGFSVIKGLFYFNYTLNKGSSFSLIKNQNTILIWVTILILGVIFYNYDKIIEHKLTFISFALIIGGAIGNLIDRIIHNGVVDFLDFIIWPVFNIADSAISIGAIMLLIYLFKK